MCRRNRSRHCFVSRSPAIASLRPRATGLRERFLNSDCSDDCPASPQRRRATSRRCSSIEVSRCPSLETSLTNVGCCCPTSQRTCCYPVSLRRPAPRVYEPQRPNCQPKCYPASTSQNATFAPVSQTMNECIDEPNDPYYNYNRNQQNPVSTGVNPMANFDLNRFDHDHTGSAGGYGRRRNVSIRTCVDYDYEPGNQHPVPSPRAYQPRPNFRQSSPYTHPYPYPPTVDDEDTISTTSRYVPYRYRR